MTLPLHDATAALAPSPSSSLTPRQRLESVLAHLPAPTGTAWQPGRNQPDAAGGESPATLYSDLVEPIQQINTVMRNYGVEFHLQEYDSRVVTRIVDRDSGDVIRQIPSEEVLRIAESLEQLQGRLIQLQA